MADRGDHHAAARLLGWREWVALPDWRISAIKAKVDTGARSSALHASDLQIVAGSSGDRVRFRLLPRQRSEVEAVTIELPVREYRSVRSSNGMVTRRPVVLVTVAWQDVRWAVEFTLVDRRDMRFRVLLGRRALRRRFRVDPGRSFLGGKPAAE